MNKKFVVTLATIFLIFGVVYLLGLISSKYPLFEYGIVDIKGQTVVPMEYEDVSYLAGNEFVVKKDKKNFIYNKNTKELTPTEYSRIKKVNDNLYLVTKGDKTGLVDKNYKVVVPVEFLTVFVGKDTIQTYRENSGCYLFDLKGNKLFGTNDYYLFDYRGGVLVAKSKKEKDKTYILSKTGKKLLTLNYSEASNIRDGCIIVKKAGKYGVVNIKGKEIVPPIYHGVFSFKDGYALVEEKRQFGVIDKTGKLVLPVSDSVAGWLSEGLVVIKDKDYKKGYYDIKEKRTIPCKYFDAMGFHNGFASVENYNGKWAFINRAGKEITPFIYSNDFMFDNGYAVVAKRSRKTLPTYDADKYKRDECGLLDLIYYHIPAKHGVIDETGKEIIPCKYDVMFSANAGSISMPFEFDYRSSSKNNYFVVGKMNGFAIFGRLLGFNKPKGQI